jgi:hypothetical protein
MNKTNPLDVHTEVFVLRTVRDGYWVARIASTTQAAKERVVAQSLDRITTASHAAEYCTTILTYPDRVPR